jgi:NTE family protein
MIDFLDAYPSTLGALACCMAASVALAQGARVDYAPQRCPMTPSAAVSTEPMPPTPHLGIALGSGSLHGTAHIGVLQELEARGVDVKVVAGTSIGALVGALWASGRDAAAIERLHRAESWEDMGRFAYSRAGIFTNDALRERLAREFAGRPIEEWPRRFGAVATDLDSGERVVLARGDGALAVQASTAVPAFYAPVTVANRRLADGALVEPVPVDLARALGAGFVIAVDVAYRPHEGEALTATQIAFQAMHILTNTLAREQMKRADVAIAIDLHETFMRCGSDALVAAGRDAMRAAWPTIVRELRRSR